MRVILYSLRDTYHILWMMVLGTSIFLVQCNDKMLNTDSAPTDLMVKQNSITDNTLLSEPIHDIQKPEVWNGDLVIYAHGYVDPQRALALPNDEIEGVPVATLVKNYGFAYATTSYPHNGLNGPEAVADILALLQEFVLANGEPNHVYLIGVSEGGLITTLTIERYPQYFTAGVAGCGPIGDFRKQINYFGDFHVLFNYFFPEIQIGSPLGVRDNIIKLWLRGQLKDKVKRMVALKTEKALTLFKVAGVPVENPNDVEELQNTIMDLLRYNILATNDVIERLGGTPFAATPFDNHERMYSGTGSDVEDARLNRKVERFEGDPNLLAVLDAQFQTTGNLARPLFTVHTINDQIIPFWHETLYQTKVINEGSSALYQNIPINRFGHCNFTLEEVNSIFQLLPTFTQQGTEVVTSK